MCQPATARETMETKNDMQQMEPSHQESVTFTKSSPLVRVRADYSQYFGFIHKSCLARLALFTSRPYQQRPHLSTPRGLPTELLTTSTAEQSTYTLALSRKHVIQLVYGHGATALPTKIARHRERRRSDAFMRLVSSHFTISPHPLPHPTSTRPSC